MLENFDLGIELDWMALILTLAFSSIFIVMVWIVPTWKSFSLLWKLALTILLPIIAYPIVLYLINK